VIRTVVAVIILATPLAALARPIHPQGVWEGTIGFKAIVACFNMGSNFTSVASYYYIDYLTPIRLHKNQEESYWHEFSDTGLWELGDPVNKTVTGIWHHPDTRKTLPIKLNYVDGREDDAACARDSFNLRLEAHPEVKASKLILFSPERKYRELRFADQVTVELFGPDPAIEIINSILKLNKSEKIIENYFKQRRLFLGRMGFPAVDLREIEILYWDQNFISMRLYFSTAGRGRMGISNDYRTWSTRSGEEIDLWQWVGDGSGERNLDPKLKEYLFSTTSEDYADCVDGYRGQGTFTIRLDKNGLQIFEEAYGDGCERYFVISFEQLLPFLNTSAKRVVSSIVESK